MDNLLQKHLKRSAIQTEVQKLSKYPMNVFGSARSPARLDYEELGGLSDPGQQDCPRARNILEVENTTWIHRTSLVSTRIGVELVDILGNQPNSSDWDPNKTRLGLSM